MSHSSMAYCTLMQYRLFWVVLDVVALEFDELIEAELAESLSFTGILPSYPCKILCVSVKLAGRRT
jgi:hypothetical protein